MSVLNVLRSLPVATNVCRLDELSADARAYARDAITLGWEDRARSRGRRVSDRGFEFGTALPRGTVLRAGDCLLLDAPRIVVMVAERQEAVFVIAPPTPAEWGLFAYHIGNNHQPLMISSDCIICPDVPGMEALLTEHGIPFSRDMRPFTPLGYAPGHEHM